MAEAGRGDSRALILVGNLVLGEASAILSASMSRAIPTWRISVGCRQAEVAEELAVADESTLSLEDLGLDGGMAGSRVREGLRLLRGDGVAGE